MGDKDILSKQIFNTLVRDFATYLFNLPVTEVELLDTAQQRVEERRADLVAKVALAEGEPFILHIEIQNNNQTAMPVRMLRYLTDLLLDYPAIPVRQYLVYIGKKPFTMADGLNLPQLAYRYEAIDMHRVNCESLLQQDSPDAWVLAILCDFRNHTPRESVRIILDRLVRALHETPGKLREYVSMLEILASNRDLNVDIHEELKMLTIEFEKLPTYRMGWDGIEAMKRDGKRGVKRENRKVPTTKPWRLRESFWIWDWITYRLLRLRVCRWRTSTGCG